MEADRGDAEGPWAKLRRRKVAQWGIAYAAGAWGLLQGLEYVTDTFGWPPQFQQLATLALLVGLPIVLVIAWYHGDQGRQRVTAAELAILTLLFLVGGGIFWRYDRASEVVSPATEATAPAMAAAPPAQSAIAEKSIAVLPFANMSDSDDTEYFSDGLAEEILNALAQISGLRVPSRTSSFAFRGREVDLRSVASALQVAHVLEGSVRRDKQRIRVTAQLIDARTDSHLWSKTWDRDLTDIFQVQQEIAVEIANSLQVQFAGPDGGPRSVGTSNVAAYERYLEARHLWRQRGEGPLRQSVARFEEAIRLDPGFARAHAGLAAATIGADFLHGRGRSGGTTAERRPDLRATGAQPRSDRSPRGMRCSPACSRSAGSGRLPTPSSGGRSRSIRRTARRSSGIRNSSPAWVASAQRTSTSSARWRWTRCHR